MTIKTILYCVVLLLCLRALATSATEIAIAERPVYQNGDVFEYVDRYQSIACQRWEIQGQNSDGALLSRCGDNIAYFTADTGALRQITGADGRRLVSFEPFATAIPFPLQVGSQWGGHFKVSTESDMISPILDEKCEVKSFEKLRIAAGEMEAFRFDCITRWSVWPLHGKVTVTNWYAPLAKTVVKSLNTSDSKWNMELARYNVQ